MKTTFAVVAFIASMASFAFAAPVAIGIQPVGTNDYGSDTEAAMVDTRTGDIVRFNPDRIDMDAQTESPRKN